MTYFVAAVFRLMRGDYDGAVTLTEAVEGTQASTSLRIDGLLLKAVALELSGKSGELEINKAHGLNPFLRETISLRIMHLLSKAEKTQNPDYQARARELVSHSTSLFDPADPWFLSVVNAVNEVPDFRVQLLRWALARQLQQPKGRGT